jgi:hypothetical protein
VKCREVAEGVKHFGAATLMLGVRRPGVTESIASLESEGMIRGRRGRIAVTNRRSLEKKAAGFYGIPQAEFRRVLG